VHTDDGPVGCETCMVYVYENVIVIITKHVHLIVYVVTGDTGLVSFFSMETKGKYERIENQDPITSRR
jgi:hypothetical protein